MSTPIDLDAIQKRADAATPGPWNQHDEEERVIVSARDSDMSLLGLDAHHGTAIFYSLLDAAFCANARADVPALIAHARAETERADKATEGLHRACCGTEDDPSNGKIHGYCVTCGVPWPCPASDDKSRLAERIRLLESALTEAREVIEIAFYDELDATPRKDILAQIDAALRGAKA